MSDDNRALPDAERSEGVRLLQNGRFGDAAALFSGVCRHQSVTAQDWYLLGVARCLSGDLTAGGDCFRRALGLRPEHTDARLGLGNVLLAAGRRDEALGEYLRVLDYDPGHAGAHNNIGDIHFGRGLHQEAERSYRAAAAAAPQLADAHYNLANVLAAGRRYKEAADYYERALVLRPAFAPAHNNFGRMRYEQGLFAEARRHFAAAVTLEPQCAGHYNNLAGALRAEDRLTEAAAAAEKAVELDPRSIDALVTLAAIRNVQGDAEETMALCRRVLDLDAGRADVRSMMLTCMHYLPRFTPADLLAAAKRWAAAHVSGCGTGLRRIPLRDPRRRLRVGYVSGDLYNHPVGHFLEPVLAHRDRAGFDVVCYSNGVQCDGQTRLLKGLADDWVDVSGLSDTDAAERIRGDEIDILVDLSGHTAKNRLLLFATRAAPVQMTWMGYFGTTGVPAMDYIIADERLIPPGSEGLYTERVLRLPHCYCSLGRPRFELEVTPRPPPRAGAVTFGAFHNPAKLVPPVVAAWSQLLRALPESRLYLNFRWFGDEGVRERFSAAFRSAGVAPEQLRFDGGGSRREMLAAYAEVDVALDPFPYNGGTTTFEALWMGVPVISLCGEAFVSRIGASVLTAARLAELVAESPTAYVEKATALARDPARLAALRDGLRRHVRASPLFDGEGFTRELERLYRDAWQGGHRDRPAGRGC